MIYQISQVAESDHSSLKAINYETHIIYIVLDKDNKTEITLSDKNAAWVTYNKLNNKKQKVIYKYISKVKVKPKIPISAGQMNRYLNNVNLKVADDKMKPILPITYKLRRDETDDS